MKKKRLVLIAVLVWSALCFVVVYFLPARKEKIRVLAITATVDSCSFKLTSNYRVDAAHWNGCDSLHRTVKKRKKKVSQPHFVSGDTLEHAELHEGRLDSLMKTNRWLSGEVNTDTIKMSIIDRSLATDFVEMLLDTPYTGTLDQIRRGKITIYGDTMKIIRNMFVMQDSLWDLHWSLRTAAAGIINATRYMKGTDAQIKRWRAAVAAYEDILNGKKLNKKGGKK